METKDIIYETKLNTIEEDEKYYYLRHRNGYQVKLDKNQSILEEVIKSIKSNGNFHHTTTSGGFIAFNKSRKYQCNLKQIILSTHMGIPLDKIQRRKIRHRNGDVTDLTVENLVLCDVVEVYHDDGCIYLYDDKGNYAFTDYYDGLYKILKSKRWAYNDVMQTFVTDRSRTSIVQIAYCYYHEGLTLDNYSMKLKKFREKCKRFDERKNYLTIDHKSADRRDNRLVNLQLVPQYVNNGRRKYMRHLDEDNCFYVPVEDGEVIGKPIYDDENPVDDYFERKCGIRPYDIQLLRGRSKTDEGIDELVDFVKNGKVSNNVLYVKSSLLMYGFFGIRIVMEGLRDYLAEVMGRRSVN